MAGGMAHAVIYSLLFHVTSTSNTCQGSEVATVVIQAEHIAEIWSQSGRVTRWLGVCAVVRAEVSLRLPTAVPAPSGTQATLESARGAKGWAPLQHLVDANNSLARALTRPAVPLSALTHSACLAI